MVYLEVLLGYGQLSQRPFPLVPLLFAEIGDRPRHSMQRVLVRRGLDEVHPCQVLPVRIRVPDRSAYFGQVQPVGNLVLVYASLSAVAGALLRAYQEQGVLHPFLIGHCHPVAEGACHPGIVPYHYCGYGGGAAVSGKFLLPLVHFLFLCAVDEYCGQGLFVFPADEYGRHGERFVRGHPQAFEVYGQVYVEASVRKGELLSGDEHFSPVEFLCTS